MRQALMSCINVGGLPCSATALLRSEFDNSRNACTALSRSRAQDDCGAQAVPAQIAHKGRRAHPNCSSGGKRIARIRFVAAISICEVLRMQSTSSCSHRVFHDHGNGCEICPTRVIQLDVHPPADICAAFQTAIRGYVAKGSRSGRRKRGDRGWGGRRRENWQHIGVSCQDGVLSPQPAGFTRAIRIPDDPVISGRMTTDDFGDLTLQ